MHRWAFIGTGDISRRLASDLQAVAPDGITAVWGRTESTHADSPTTTASRSRRTRWSSVLALDTVDIVYIATPAATHLRYRARRRWRQASTSSSKSR